MMNSLQYRFQLRRLQSDRRQRQKSNDKMFDQAKQDNKTDDELFELAFNQHNEIGYIDEAIWSLQNEYIRSDANKYLIPIPAFSKNSGDWIETIRTGTWRLSPEALALIRTSIRQEKKERRGWIPLTIGLLGAATGLLGATISLIVPLSK